MKKLYTLLFAFALTFSVNAQTTIAQWNFDAATPADAMIPSTGSGIFTTIGGVVDNLTSNAMPGGIPTTGKAYSIKGFPDQGTLSGTAGFQFAVSTVGYSDITIKFDPRASGTASKWQQFEFSTDGSTWTVFSNNGGALANDFLNPVSITLPATVANNANFKFRIVSIFAPSSSEYAPVGTSYAGSTGAWRIDNFTVAGASLSINENAIAGLKVYPNPLSGSTLFIDTNANAEKTVVIYDVLGKAVLNTKTASNALNVSNLNGGVYVVKITEEGKTATRKLVIK